MLNYIAIWLGVYLFSSGGPLQNDRDASLPVSNDVVESAQLPVFWGDPVLQGLHIGMFISLAAVVVFWLMLNRSTAGYEVRAVGLNPEAARYAGMNVSRNYVLVMAICGAVRGPRGRARRPRLAVPARAPTTSRSRSRASSASPSRCSAATPRSGRSPPRCCSARC